MQLCYDPVDLRTMLEEQERTKEHAVSD